MTKTIASPRQKALCRFITEQRKNAGLSQKDVAKALGEHQSFVARLESGQRRIDVVEYLRLAEVIGFDPQGGIRSLRRVK